jgi:hypothetical protein
MAMVRRDKDEENDGELHGMNNTREGGRTHVEVTRVMVAPLNRQEGIAEHTWSIDGALV